MSERSRRLIQLATLGKYAEHIFRQGLGIIKMNPYYMLLLIAHIRNCFNGEDDDNVLEKDGRSSITSTSNDDDTPYSSPRPSIFSSSEDEEYKVNDQNI